MVVRGRDEAVSARAFPAEQGRPEREERGEERKEISPRGRDAPAHGSPWRNDGRGKGLKFERRFTLRRTADGHGDRILDPYETLEWERRNCRILNSDGSVVFEIDDVEIPAHWSTIAGDIMASKYTRKAGVPQFDEQGNPILDDRGKPVTGREQSTRQVVKRLVSCWRHWGDKYGYFGSPEDAAAFEDELAYMLLHQMAAPNSPQWFNTGLYHVYGITGPSQGHYYVDSDKPGVQKSTDAYSRPQPHACFIQSVGDDLVNTGGIMELWVREARLFKYGSGTGTNFSAIRGEGEPLAGGGVSSGLMSFLKIGDRAAGAIKSGGTTRRAAKMVCLDLDHPDVEAFINWKAQEEQKARTLIAAGYSPDFNGEAYATISGQNSNNSIRIPHRFLEKLDEDGNWELRWRTDGRICKVVKARSIWDQICHAAWQCADPGVQFDTTINDWHTCPAAGRINASNPCSEYMFLDNTACNLSSLNLARFYDVEKQRFDVEAFRHACRLWTTVLEISVLMAQYPSPEIADLSYRFRTLGLGYANLGTVLMLSGVPYDSAEGRAICGAITAIMTAESYATSAEMAKELGHFPGYQENRGHMIRVMRNHRRTAYSAPASEYEGLSIPPQGIDESACPPYLLEAAREGWDRVIELGQQYGYRNAQTTVIAPTGTIGLLMDCDTTGIEPDYGLVKFKKLAGGGYFKIPNRSVDVALKVLGYTPDQIHEMLEYMVGTGSLGSDANGDPAGLRGINRETLRQAGLLDEELDAIERILPRVFELSSAFTRWTLDANCFERFGIDRPAYEAEDFNFLRTIGFSAEEIAAANERICGHHTLEGAPHLREEHIPVFDCANRCGKKGQRFISPEGHLRMMAAAQPFISGALSKTVNMPHDSTVEDIGNAYLLSWKLGLKATALYRDGCKASQPLSTSSGSGAAVRRATSQDEDEGKVRAPDSRRRRAGNGVGASAEEPLRRSPRPRTRRPLPAKRHGFTQEAKVAGHKIYLRTGEYEDGTLGEIFVDMHKEGAAFRAIMNCFAIAVSKGLQYGVPLEEFVDTFTFTRFAPQGQVQGHPNIKMATSVVDYVFRVLGLEYLKRTDFVHVKPSEIQDGDPAEKALADDAGKRGPSGAPKSRGSGEACEGESEDGCGEAGGDAPGCVASPEGADAGEARNPALPEGKGSNGSGPADLSDSGIDLPPAGAGIAEEASSYLGEYRLRRTLGEEGGRFDLQSYDEQLEEFMGDAPLCDKCGHHTIRSGSCYRCLVCGESMGCS